MGIRFRKSIKLAPGIKLNISKKSVGISAGTKGARVSVNSNGKITKSIGIPGTGVSYVKTSKLNAGPAIVKNTKESSPPHTDQPDQANGFHAPNNNSFKPSNNTSLLKKILRVFLYIFIPLVAIGINANFFFPAILLESIYHMVRIRKAVPPLPHKRISTCITGFVIALSAFGSVTTYSPSVESISLSVKNNTIDINENQLLDITVLPESANAPFVFDIEDDTILTIEKNNSNIFSIHPLSEGTTEVIATSGKVQSNPISITIIDQERIAAEKKAEEERIAAEKKAEEERIAAEKKAEEERIAAEKKAEEQAAAQKAASSTQTNSRTVYVTPTGKRYHYNSSCNGGSYSSTTLDRALSMGLTPCKKCVQ